MNVIATAATDDRLALAKTLGLKAGKRALDYYKNRETLTIETKRDPQDVVSIADRDVEQYLRGEIARHFPDDGVLGEEYGLEPGKSGYTWVLDPIDGTSPFVNGMPNWCVSIAVIKDGLPVVGVINAPCHDELYAASKGKGATLNDKPLRLDGSRNIRNAVTGIGANSHVTPQVVAGIVERLLEAGGNFIRNGSGALMLAYVAAGRLVGYYEPYMHAWDCMAAFCLIEEAGGRFHPFPVDGEKLTKGGPVLAAGPGAYEDLEKIAQITG